MYQSQQSLYQIKEMTDQFEVEKLQLKQRLEYAISENLTTKQKYSVIVAKTATLENDLLLLSRERLEY